jgi:hypothetical protein
MHIRWRPILFFGLMLVLPLLACNQSAGEVEAPVPTQLPTAEPPAQVDEAPGAEELPRTSEPAAREEEESEEALAMPELSRLEEQLAQYNSYRIRIRVTFEDDNGEENGDASGSMELKRARTINPPASRITLRGGGAVTQELEDATGEGELSFVELAGETYSVVPGAGCFAGHAEAAGATEGFADLLDSEQLLGSVQRTDRIGEEEVNGQTVDHYYFDRDDVTGAAPLLQDVRGDIFLAHDGGYPVRVVYEGVGYTDMFGQGSPENGRLRVEYDVFDVGAPLEIEVPEECVAASAQFPIMSGAREVSSMPGFVSYRVNASLEEVVAFYEQELEVNGYTAGDEQIILEETAILLYTTTDDRPDINVALTAEGGEILVLITAEES